MYISAATQRHRAVVLLLRSHASIATASITTATTTRGCAHSSSSSSRFLSTNAAAAAPDTAALSKRSSANLFQNPKGDPPGVARLVARYAAIPLERTRCFSIIAHIDHGKSTLADKLLASTQNIWPTTKGHQQVLDTLEVERSRGITVKAQSASMVYTNPADGLDYLLNLIDTPGHVDFSGEVARSLAACQGALLLVDCSQGVQAQTVANHTAAVEAGLRIVPVLTKIDLPTADPEPSLTALETAFGIPQDDVIWTSAKTGAGIDEVLPAVIARLPSPGPNSKRAAPLRCLCVDSWFDEYRGVVCSLLIAEGSLRPGDVIVAAHSGDRFTVQELGLMAPSKVPIGAVSGPHSSSSGGTGALSAGHIGYMIAGMRSTKQAVVGDTFSLASDPQPPLPGFRPAKPMVFASLYPVDSGDFAALATAVERLTLNDASVSVERESSNSLGFGLRCGFLGLLHMDVFHQRLSSEWDMPVIITAPMVRYRLTLTPRASASSSSGAGALIGGSAAAASARSGDVFTPDGRRIVTAERPADFPPPQDVDVYEEPTAHVSILAPEAFLSPLLALLADRRGVQEDITYISAGSGVPVSSFAAPPAPAAEAADGDDVVVDGDDAVVGTVPTTATAGAHIDAHGSASVAKGSSGSTASSNGNASRSSSSGGSGVSGSNSSGVPPAFGSSVDTEGDEEGEDEDDDDDDEEDEEEGGDGSSAGAVFKQGVHHGSSSAASTAAVIASSGGFNGTNRVVLKYRVPWAEVVTNFVDAVKSLTAGYASVDWSPGPYQRADILKVDMLVNAKPVDALSFVAHADKAVSEGRRIAQRLKGVISRQQFEIVIQAAIGSKVIARERVAPYRKDVLIKSGKTVGGGDRTRKQKLLSKQKEGKKRLKTVGNVELSQEAFHSIMSSK